MKNEKQTARRFQAIAICGCLCLLAVGAGVAYRGMQEPIPSTEAPVTAVTTPTTQTLEQAMRERNQQNREDGEAPDGNDPKQTQQKNQNTTEEQETKKEATTQTTKETTKETTTAPQQEAPKGTSPSGTEKTVFSAPVQGEIVLPYSVDHAIYDPTLDQYRTNAGVSISAEEGTPVKAAAAGTIRQVTQKTEAGNVVVIKHSNGWLTTYGQLAEAIPVKEGDRVQQGQTIGQVDAPTKYGVALGSHLEFAMEQEGTSVDPTEWVR